MPKFTHNIVPKGRGYTIQRQKGGLREALVVRGEDYKFANRSNAEAYVELLDEDHEITRNDHWMPLGTVYQGGTLARSIRHQGA